MTYLSKIQNLPERTRKIILWIAVVIIGLTLMSCWVYGLKKRLAEFRKENFPEEILKGMPPFNSGLPDFSPPEIPPIPPLEELNKEK